MGEAPAFAMRDCWNRRWLGRDRLTRMSRTLRWSALLPRTPSDGNKRTAWVVCAVFMELNGRHVIASQADVVTTMLGVADGSLNEESFVAWLAGNSHS